MSRQCSNSVEKKLTASEKLLTHLFSYCEGYKEEKYLYDATGKYPLIWNGNFSKFRMIHNADHIWVSASFRLKDKFQGKTYIEWLRLKFYLVFNSLHLINTTQGQRKLILCSCEFQPISKFFLCVVQVYDAISLSWKYTYNGHSAIIDTGVSKSMLSPRHYT